MIGELVFSIFALMAQGQAVDSSKVAETGNAPVTLIEKQEKEPESQVAGATIVCSVEFNDVRPHVVIRSPDAAFIGTGTLVLEGYGMSRGFGHRDTRPIDLVAGSSYIFSIPNLNPFPENIRAKISVKDQGGNIVCNDTQQT